MNPAIRVTFVSSRSNSRRLHRNATKITAKPDSSNFGIRPVTARPLHPVRCWMPALLSAVLLIACGTAHGHEIGYQAGTAEAVTVEFSFPHGRNPVDQPYAIHRAGEESAFQTGRTDILGRLSFLPDEPGDWQVRLTTADGHGASLTVTMDEAGTIDAVRGPGHNRFTLIVAGIGYLVGLAGVWVLFRRRRD